MYHVYIGNIPFTTQWQELKDHLRTAGDVYRVEIPESYDGRPKALLLQLISPSKERKMQSIHSIIPSFKEEN